MDNKQRKKRAHSRGAVWGILFFGVIVLIGAISLVGILSTRTSPTILQGTIEAPEVRIAGKLPGRVTHIYVSEGESVAAGDTLIAIHSPEVEAQRRQAQAVEGAARAQSNKIDQGTRPEIVASARQAWLSAKSQRTFAESSFRRIERLWRDSVVSLWRKEEAEALFRSAEAMERAAYEQYRLARVGAQAEDKQSAAYMTEAAEGTVGAVDALLADSFLTAPSSGTVATIYPEVGELVGTGTPLLTIVELEAPYATFNIREDVMPHIGLGERFLGRVPAVGDNLVEWEVFYISPLGSFATWRTSHPGSLYDMRTFEVHARPTTLCEGILPGMSVVVEFETEGAQ